MTPRPSNSRTKRNSVRLRKSSAPRAAAVPKAGLLRHDRLRRGRRVAGFLGATTSPQSAFCQIPGATARIAVEDFRRALNHHGALHALLNRFTQATMVQIGQNVVCNSTHSTEARMARWLITTHDRVAKNEFLLTQEFLSQMLGVARPTVSETAQRIQAEGSIRYSRGTMTIVDRQALGRTACACYQIIKSEFDDLRYYGA